MDVNTVFRLGLNSHLFLTAFDDSETGGPADDPVLLGEGEDKETSPLTPPVSDRSARPHEVLKSPLFGTEIKNVPDYVY